MENNSKKTRVLTKAQQVKKALENREKIAMHLDNYDLAISVALNVIAVEGVSDDNISKANEVISITLDKLKDL